MAHQQQQQQQRAQPQSAPPPPPPFATMQFDRNSDYPFPSSSSSSGEAARSPPPFPPARIGPCARITTRVYDPRRGTVTTVRDVLVGTAGSSLSLGGGTLDEMADDGGGGGGNINIDDYDDDDSWTSSESETESEAMTDRMMDDGTVEEAEVEEAEDRAAPRSRAQRQQPQSPQPQSQPQLQPHRPDRAYWLQRTLREAIYGRVRYGVVLRRRTKDDEEVEVEGQMTQMKQEVESSRKRSWNEPFRAPAEVAGVGTVPSPLHPQRQPAAIPPPPPPPPVSHCEWEVTNEKCAVKEMNWAHIRRERNRLAEDPIKEVSSMQYLKKYLERCRAAANNGGAASASSSSEFQTAEDMLDTHIMLPLDVLSDDRCLYSVMPYCDGGELFDRLDARAKFSEDECRYWMHQILKGLDNLQQAGICHRDMSLENLLLHKDRICLIIDMGMCLRIPYEEEDEQQQQQVESGGSTGLMETDAVMESFAEMNVDGGGDGTPNGSGGGGMVSVGVGVGGGRANILDHRRRKRYIVKPQGTCGKWHYMSPEIALNKTPFDGHAVDMWATGVILFLMLTGFPPWERPCRTDERFKYMTAGYLVQMLTEWELGLSPDAMDLLQRMLWLDPKDRLSLEQVRAHPWMVNGRMALSGGGDVGMGVQPR